MTRIRPGGGISLASANASYAPLDALRLKLNDPSAGVDAVQRDSATSGTACSAGTLFVSCFTAVKTATITKITMATHTTAAGATPTLVRMGLYTISGSTGTLVAATASDTALFASVSTVYDRTLDTGGGLPASYGLTAGTRYGIGVLVVTGAAAPTLAAAGPLQHVAAVDPILCGQLAGQSDLPPSASLSSSARRFWGRVS